MKCRGSAAGVGYHSGLHRYGATFHAGWVQGKDGDLPNRIDAFHLTVH